MQSLLLNVSAFIFKYIKLTKNYDLYIYWLDSVKFDKWVKYDISYVSFEKLNNGLVSIFLCQLKCIQSSMLKLAFYLSSEEMSMYLKSDHWLHFKVKHTKLHIC